MINILPLVSTIKSTYYVQKKHCVFETDSISICIRNTIDQLPQNRPARRKLNTLYHTLGGRRRDMMQSRRKSTLCCTFVALSVPFPSDQGLFPARTIAVLVLLLNRPGCGRCTMIYATGFFPHSSSALIGLLLWLLRCNYWFYEVNNLLWFCGTECKPLSEHNVSTCFLVFLWRLFFSVKDSLLYTIGIWGIIDYDGTT